MPKTLNGIPRAALYLTVYVRLVDAGYPTKFDWAYFAGLPRTAEGLVEAIRGMGSAQLH